MKYIYLIFILIFAINIKATPLDSENDFLSDFNMADEELFVEFYSIPSPDEIMSYIHNNEIKYTPQILLSSQNISKYRTNTEKQLALGFYLADMAYTISFNKTTSSLQFLEAIESIGKNINILPQELDVLGERIVKNIDKLDSLSFLYDEIYLSIIGHLHETARFGEYAIISAAAFVESMHLALNSEKTENNEDEFNKRVWEQKMIIDQIQKMFDRYLSVSIKDSMTKDMNVLSEAYNAYISLNTSTKSSTLKTGAVLIGIEQPIEREYPPIDDIINGIKILRSKWTK